jgi:uncharacterized BrkB/YihY/UPF0761 family membrane protein
MTDELETNTPSYFWKTTGTSILLSIGMIILLIVLCMVMLEKLKIESECPECVDVGITTTSFKPLYISLGFIVVTIFLIILLIPKEEKHEMSI